MLNPFKSHLRKKVYKKIISSGPKERMEERRKNPFITITYLTFYSKASSISLSLNVYRSYVKEISIRRINYLDDRKCKS